MECEESVQDSTYESSWYMDTGVERLCRQGATKRRRLHRRVSREGVLHACFVTFTRDARVHETRRAFMVRCSQTFALRDCMLQNKDYYAPVLEEEDAFVDEKEQDAGGEKQALASDEKPTGDAAAASQV